MLAGWNIPAQSNYRYIFLGPVLPPIRKSGFWEQPRLIRPRLYSSEFHGCLCGPGPGSRRRNASGRAAAAGLHPVSVTRFPSFRTQTLENLSRYLWSKWVPEQPRPWRKSCDGESCDGDRVYITSNDLYLCVSLLTYLFLCFLYVFFSAGCEPRV